MAAVACGGDAEPNTQNVGPAVGTGGTTAGVQPATTGGTSASTTPAAPTAGMSSTGATAGAAPGTTAGTSPATTAGTATTGSTAGTSMMGTAAGTSMMGMTTGTGGTGGTGATGGTGGTGGGGAPLKAKCEGADTVGCSSFMSPSGKEVQLGPYGAAMDVNVGKGFEVPVDPQDNKSGCEQFAGIFGQAKEETDKLLDLGTTDLKLFTVFRPANFKAGEKYPLITWGNGTCAQPGGYGTLLRYVASHGFVVVAGNSRYVGSTGAMTKALDFMFKANDDMTSPYYQKLDLTKVGAAGHSQGGAATVTTAGDARVKAVILYNGGDQTSKPFMVVSGDDDIPFIAPAVSDMKANINRASKAAYLYFHMIPMPPGGMFNGHLTLMQQPERLTDASVAWWKLVFNDDPAWKDWFVGASCKLCGKTSDFEFGQKGFM